MSTTWKTVRVFISSTFRDMQAERDWLVKRVFPALRQRLEPHRIHLVDVDLRWGITRQQADNDQVLGLCLEQIDECRPFFLGLLGGRYGWVPSKFPVEVGKRYGWTQAHTGKSVTELEILHGVLNDPAMHGRALFCIRDDRFLNAITDEYQRRVYVEGPTNEELRDLGPEEAERPATNRRRQLAGLKETIRKLSPPMPLLDGYLCQWNPTLPDPVSKTPGRLDGLKKFGDWVIEKLEHVILNAPELKEYLAAVRIEARNELDEERGFHEQFIENRTRVYIGRQQLQDELRTFVTSGETKPCLVTGPSGSGKSAALAKFVSIWRTQHPQEIVIAYFVGASPHSTSLREILRHLCTELKEALKLQDEIKQDVRELSDQFHEFLAKVPADRRVLLVLDALNQFDETDNAHTLHWLPTQIPPQVRLMVSCIDDPVRPDQPALAAMRHHTPHEIKIGLLTDDERLGIMREIPSVAAKTLDKVQIGLLLQNPATKNPLFLLVALEELRGFGSFEKLNQKIARLPQEGDTLTAIFQQVIRRLGEDFNAVTVKDVLTLLACSRRGLSERELLDLIEGKQVRIEDSAEDLFPILRQLRPYLQSRGPLLDFYHRHLAIAIQEKFFKRGDGMPRATHQRLANYFHSQDYFLEPVNEQRERVKRLPPTPRPANVRKVDELPRQCLQAAILSEEWGTVETLFTHLLFLEAKAEAGLIFDLAVDFRQTLEALPAERAQRPILRMLEEALLRDILFLSRHPTALFQCLWNTCWWFKGETKVGATTPHATQRFGGIKPLLIGWRRQRRRLGLGNIWIRSLRPPPIPLHSGLLAVFRGHEDRILDVQFSPKSDTVASSSADRTVRLWDRVTGREHLSFERHSAPVHLLAFSPDGETLASASIDGNLWVWSTLDAAPTRRINFRTNIIERDSKADPTAFLSIQFTDVDLEHRRDSPEPIMRSLHPESPLALSFLPQERLFVCVGNSVCVIDLITRKILYDIPLGSTKVDAAACDTDGTQFACALSDGTVKLIDLQTQRPLGTMQYPGRRIWRLAFATSKPLVVLALDDHSVRLLNTHTPGEVASVHAHLDDGTLRVFDQQGNPVGMLAMKTPLLEPSRGALALAVAQHGDTFACGGADGVLQIWQPSTKEMIARVHGHDQAISALSFSICGQFVASASSDGTARVWQLSELRRMEYQEEHTDTICAIEFCAGGQRVVSAGLDGAVHFYNSCTGRLLAQHRHRQPVRALVVSKDSRLVASAGDDGQICLWEGTSGKLLLHCQAHSDSIHALVFSTDGCLLASAGTDRVVNVWHTKDLSRLARLTLADQTDCSWCLRFSCDGSLLSAGTIFGLVNTWRCSDWHVVSTYDQAKMFVTAIDLSPEASHLAIGTMDGSVHIWDTGDGSHRAARRRHTHTIANLLYSADGKRLVTESMDNTIREWDAVTGLCLRIVKGGRYIEGFAGQDLPLWGTRVTEAHETLFDYLPVSRCAGVFPFMLAKATTAQNGRIWAGVGDRNFYLVSIEHPSSRCIGAPARGNTDVSVVLLQAIGGEGSACDRLASQAQLFEANGELLNARQALEEQETLLRSLSDSVQLQKCLGHQARIRSQQGDYEGALNLLQQQEAVCNSHALKNELLECLKSQLSVIREMKQESREELQHE